MPHCGGDCQGCQCWDAIGAAILALWLSGYGTSRFTMCRPRLAHHKLQGDIMFEELDLKIDGSISESPVRAGFSLPPNVTCLVFCTHQYPQ
jgi:hypothetical protein